MNIYINRFIIISLILSVWIVINTSQTVYNNIPTPQNSNKLPNDYIYYFQIHRYNFQFDFDNNNNNIISNHVNTNHMDISIDNININVLFYMNTSSYIFNINNNISLNYDYDGDWNEVQTLILTSPSQYQTIEHDDNNIGQYMEHSDNQEYFDENDDELLNEYMTYEDDEDINDIFDDNPFDMISHALYEPTHKSGRFIGIQHPRQYYDAQRICHHKYNGQLAYINKETDSQQLYELCKILLHDNTERNGCWIGSKQSNNTCIEIIDDNTLNNNQCSVANPFICETETIPIAQTDKFVAIGNALDWDKANEYCDRRFDTELASILSVEDNTYVNNICKNVADGESCWIGLERPFDKWQDQNTVNYNNWNSNEPNNYANDESCTEIINNNAQWNDLACRNSKYFICNFIGIDKLNNQQYETTTPQRRRLRNMKRIPIYRYWKGGAKDHFYTQSSREIGTTTAGRTGKHGYRSEGISYYLHQARHSGMVPVYRYWNGKIQDHFYTTNKNEIGTPPGRRGKHGYDFESVLGYCYPRRKSGTIPVYRYYVGGDHFYTANVREIGTGHRGRRGKHGYVSEGVMCYAWNKAYTPPPRTNWPNYKWKGCYKDTGRRSFRYGPHRWGYSVDKCYRACKRSGYHYFALQAGSWCSCENSWSHARKYGRGGGCPRSRLGAGWRNDVFQIKKSRRRGRKYGYVAKEASGKTARLSCKSRSKIRVLTASYGANCKDKNRNNARSRLSRACNKKRSCRYKVDHRKIGDPAPGCAKDYTFQYQCKRKRRKKRKPRRKRKRRKRKRRRRKRRKKRKRKSYSRWKCSKVTRSDYDQKVCLRRRSGMIRRLGRDRARRRWLRQLRHWMSRQKKRGYGGVRGLGNGYQRGYAAGKRSALARLQRRSGIPGMRGLRRIRMPRKVRLRRIKNSRVPLPPRIQLIDLIKRSRRRLGLGEGFEEELEGRLIWDIEEDVDVYEYGDMMNERKCMLYKEESVYEVCVGYNFVEIKKYIGRKEKVLGDGDKLKGVSVVDKRDDFMVYVGYEYEKYKSMMNDVGYVKDKMMLGSGGNRDTYYLDLYEFVYDERDEKREQCFMNMEFFDVCLGLNERNDMIVRIEGGYDNVEYGFNFSNDNDWNEIDEIIEEEDGKSIQKCVRLFEVKMCMVCKEASNFKIVFYKTA